MNAMAPPSRTWNGYRMTSDQLSKMDTIYGQMLKQQMDSVLENGTWAESDDTRRQMIIQQLHNKAATYAHNVMRQEEPDINQSVINKKIESKTHTKNYTGQGFANPSRLSSYRGP